MQAVAYALNVYLIYLLYIFYVTLFQLLNWPVPTSVPRGVCCYRRRYSAAFLGFSGALTCRHIGVTQFYYDSAAR